jgi:nucleoid-associated protein YgaU
MRKFLAALTVSLALIQGAFAAGDSILRPDHPERYLVKTGDTLWDIGAMFLTDAWLWPEIWYINPEIENPHLIYPGDTIFLSFVDGEPRLSVERGEPGRTDKLSPQTRREGDRYQKVDPRVPDSRHSAGRNRQPADHGPNRGTGHARKCAPYPCGHR